MPVLNFWKVDQNALPSLQKCLQNFQNWCNFVQGPKLVMIRRNGRVGRLVTCVHALITDFQFQRVVGWPRSRSLILADDKRMLAMVVVPRGLAAVA